MKRQIISILLVLTLVFSIGVPVCAARTVDQDEALVDTAQLLLETVTAPRYGSVGGEWVVLGMARSGTAVPNGYYQGYYDALKEHVAECGGELHARKYTEYSRVILALSALGVDARSVAGYDLNAPLQNYEKTVWQGVNGPIYALLALDSRNYPAPEGLRQRYVDYILSCQLSDGGWSLSGSTADPDVTGMALQALAKYQEQDGVKEAIENALDCMSSRQGGDGGFSTWGIATAESCAQMIVALCELGLSLDDPRFVKAGNTLLDGLLAFYEPGKGFRHTLTDPDCNQMATEQAFYALAAFKRMQAGENSLYHMKDAEALVALVKTHDLCCPGKTFSDLSGHKNQGAIEALAQHGIVSGKGNGLFDPDATMTRCEFAAIVVTALGLRAQEKSVFSDVASGSWYASYVGTAYSYGIVSGVGSGKFAPFGTVTRQEAACMILRAARLCGLDTAMTNAEIDDVLTCFGDHTACADWAEHALAFCYRENILPRTDQEIGPARAITRGETALMIYHLLTSAQLM